MKYNSFLVLGVIILVILFVVTSKEKEGFMNSYCQTYTNCQSCANASGCSWCPNASRCINSTTLKSTDRACNELNVINSGFNCTAALRDEIPPEKVVQDDILYDYVLYKNQITDRIPPPNIFTTEKVEYTNQDVIGNMNNVRNDMANLRTELPGIIASSVESNIKPMVKGILSENYYIQG
jgi:hypothetical protein